MIERIYEGGLLVKETDYGLLTPEATLTPELGLFNGAAMGLLKSEPEYRVTVGVAYPANLPDNKLAKDGHRDFAPAELVEQIAWRWMKERQELGLFHQEGTEGHGVPVESGIHRGPDWLVKTATAEVTVCEGDWVLAVEWDQPAWNWIKSNPTAGWSPQGEAYRMAPSPEALARLRSR